MEGGPSGVDPEHAVGLTLEALKRWDKENHPFNDNAKIMSYGSINRYWFWKLD